MNPLLVYVTTKNEEEAKAIGKALLERKLVSCANILPITSLYRWEGNIEDDTEAALLLKTFDAHYDAVEQAIKKTHSYDVPCIIAWPLPKGNKEYIKWSKHECTSAQTTPDSN